MMSAFVSTKSDLLARCSILRSTADVIAFSKPCSTTEQGFHTSFTTINYTSIFAYLAFFSINARRGATSSPISIEKV